MKRFLFLIVLVIAPTFAFGAGGTCPTGANYVNPASPYGALVTLSSLGITSCYFADYTNGADTATGTSESVPWKSLPGMNSCGSNCSGASITAGEGFIMKGCVTWPNAALPWVWGTNGTSGNPIYIGVDKTWWDSTVSGCSSSWNRPILNGQSLSTNRGNSREDMVTLYQQYTYFDDIEMTGHLANPTNNATDMIDLLGGSGPTGSQGVIISRMYMHGWVNPYFCYGTGNIAANSSTVTNFIPIYCNANFPTGYATNSAMIQVYPQGSYWPVQSSAPNVTGITGSNPYTITTNSTTVATVCTACNVIIGLDEEKILSGNETGNSGAQVILSYIDGSDTAEVVNLNPYGDCGVSESNNNLCVGSGTAEWRGPQIWRGNFIQYVESVAVGGCTEWSANLMQYIRPSIDPTGHTNGIECVDDDPVNNVTAFYNNVFRHSTNPNSNTPGGQITIGLGWVLPAPVAGETSYLFNNVAYDTITNTIYERGTSTGNWAIFNNSGDCGPSWNLSYQCIQAGESGDIAENNHFVTSNGTPIGANNTQTTNLIQTTAQADQNLTPKFDQYTPAQSYAYSPVAVTNSTVAAGTNITSLCSTIASANAFAGAACLDATPYGITANATTHTIAVGSLTAGTRTTTPDIGAYLYPLNSGQAATPTFSPVAGTYNATQSVTISSSTSGAWICYNTTGSPATNGTGNGCNVGTHYTTPVSVPSSETLYAVAGTASLADSSVGSAAYTIIPAGSISTANTIRTANTVQQ